MANKTKPMDLINQIKLLKELGYGSKTITRDLGMSKNTVKKYLTLKEIVCPDVNKNNSKKPNEHVPTAIQCHLK